MVTGRLGGMVRSRSARRHPHTRRQGLTYHALNDQWVTSVSERLSMLEARIGAEGHIPIALRCAWWHGNADVRLKARASSYPPRCFVAGGVLSAEPCLSMSRASLRHRGASARAPGSLPAPLPPTVPVTYGSVSNLGGPPPWRDLQPLSLRPCRREVWTRARCHRGDAGEEGS